MHDYTHARLHADLGKPAALGEGDLKPIGVYPNTPSIMPMAYLNR
jgi:hypothetical protein